MCHISMIVLLQYVTIASCLSQHMMLDIVIFLFLPVDLVMMGPVVFTPGDPSSPLRFENKRTDHGCLRCLHDDSAIDDVSIREGIFAVDGVIFNWESFDGHVLRRDTGDKLWAPVEPGRNSSLSKTLKIFFSSVCVLSQASKSCSTRFSCLSQQVRSTCTPREWE